MHTSRKIIHCDCDCFYASIEMRDNPSLVGKPIAVGGSPTRRGVVATCNYEARKYGIHSAMASSMARNRCPELIIIRPDMEKYRKASELIHEIFARYTSIIEPLSLDEAFLDVSNCSLFEGSATLIAKDIRKSVKKKVGITISAGIAPNKFLAKIASDWNKPDGQFVIKPEQVEGFLKDLPVKKLHGVGKVTARKMHSIGIQTCGDLRGLSEGELQDKFGSSGNRLFLLAKGIDDRPVKTERIRKSLSVETTFSQDIVGLTGCVEQLPILMEQFRTRLEKIQNNHRITKQVVKIKFNDFNQTTVETISPSVDSEIFRELLEEGYKRRERPVRLLGIGVKLEPNSPEKTQNNETDQLSLTLDDTEDLL